MALLFAILFWLLVGLLFLIALALVTPIFVRVHLATLPRLAYQIELRPFAGMAPCFRLGSGPQDGAKAKPRQREGPPKRRKSSKVGFPNSAMVKAAPSLIKGLLRRIKLVELEIDADFGLGDPAETGRLCGVVMPLQHTGLLSQKVTLNLRPDFGQAILNGSLTAVIHVTVAALFVPVLQAAWRVYGPLR